MPYVTRIAPSPTGMFHLGTARTAYFNYLAAKASDGKMYLRIDDTDAARNDDKFTQIIFDSLNWLGISGSLAFNQSDKFQVDGYKQWAEWLIDSGWATRLPDEAIAFIIKDDLPDSWFDLLAGTVKITDNDLKLIDGMILIRSNGTPTYNFASMVDDKLYGVNLIIRGTDHISNTAKQIAIKTAMEDCDMDSYTNIEFAHVGLIMVNKDGKRVKLSKRDDAASLLSFRDAGVHPDAMLNFLLRMGWSPSDANYDRDHPIITKDDAIKLFFDGGKLRNSPALFDPAKLAFYDKKYKNLKSES